MSRDLCLFNSGSWLIAQNILCNPRRWWWCWCRCCCLLFGWYLLEWMDGWMVHFIVFSSPLSVFLYAQQFNDQISSVQFLVARTWWLFPSKLHLPINIFFRLGFILHKFLKAMKYDLKDFVVLSRRRKLRRTRQNLVFWDIKVQWVLSRNEIKTITKDRHYYKFCDIWIKFSWWSQTLKPKDYNPTWVSSFPLHHLNFLFRFRRRTEIQIKTNI